MLDWTAGGSRAFNETPDYVKMEFNGRRVYSQNSAERSWEHNSDRDLSAAANLAYKLKMTAGQSIDVKAGGSTATRSAKASTTAILSTPKPDTIGKLR